MPVMKFMEELKEAIEQAEEEKRRRENQPKRR